MRNGVYQTICGGLCNDVGLQIQEHDQRHLRFSNKFEPPSLVLEFSVLLGAGPLGNTFRLLDMTFICTNLNHLPIFQLFDLTSYMVDRLEVGFKSRGSLKMDKEISDIARRKQLGLNNSNNTRIAKQIF